MAMASSGEASCANIVAAVRNRFSRRCVAMATTSEGNAIPNVTSLKPSRYVPARPIR